MNRRLWAIALACWLVLYGLLALTNLRFEMQGFLMGLLAIAAGILILLDK